MKSINKTIWTAAGLLGLIAIFALPAAADQVILDDLIVDGSICVGLDCVNGESFGFDTLRLKENNLRIHAQDTSSSASFPTYDWRLTFNDSSNGGRNRFSVECVDEGRESFTIEGCAPSNSLYVDDGGRIGFGTANPVVELHVVDGDTPTLRLEQDGSSGFTPQTWDVAGNEANFFIRDATNGSKLPFKIKPGAPTGSIFVAASGKIGLGTESPGGDLHVRDASANAVFDLDAASVPQVWRFSISTSDSNLRIRDNTAAQDFLTFNAGSAGDVTVAGVLFTNGPTCSGAGGCDGVFSPEYEVEPIEEHAAEMWQHGYLPAVGPTLPKVKWNLTEKAGNMLNELEKAHIYIEQLHDRLARVEALLEAAQAESND